MKQNYFVPIKGALFCGLLWLMSITAFAQKSVSGKVSDAKGDGVPGASITVKGTTTGTISDANGGFKINVPNSGGTLVFSSIGYKTQEVKLSRVGKGISAQASHRTVRDSLLSYGSSYPIIPLLLFSNDKTSLGSMLALICTCDRLTFDFVIYTSPLAIF
jgi:hypothetical protein